MVKAVSDPSRQTQGGMTMAVMETLRSQLPGGVFWNASPHHFHIVAEKDAVYEEMLKAGLAQA